MKKKLEYLGRIDGLRTWKAWSSVKKQYAIVVELLSKFWFHPDMDIAYANDDGNFDLEHAFNWVSYTSRGKRPKPFWLHDGVTVEQLFDCLHKVAPHVFPEFPEKCRNCLCLAIRKDGFIGCISESHVRWDYDYSTDNKHFATCSDVVESERCYPSAVREFDIVQPRLSAYHFAMTKDKREERKRIEDMHSQAFATRKLLYGKIPSFDDIVNRIDRDYFRISTHHDYPVVLTDCDDTDKVVVGFDVGWLNRGVVMEKVIEDVVAAFSANGIKVQPDPRKWFAWNYNLSNHGGNHEYVYFRVEKF